MSRTPPNANGFTLVEIVLAIGVFVFAITGVVYLLGVALQSSSETQRDSALSSAVSTAAGMLRTYDDLPPPATLYFDQQGSLVTATKDAHYQLVIAPVTGTITPLLDLYSIKATAPYPAPIPVGTFLASRPKR